MEIISILKEAVTSGASDIFIVAGLPITFKIKGNIQIFSPEKLTPAQTAQLISNIYVSANNRDMAHLTEKGDDDFSFALKSVSRFRASAYKQRGTLAIVIRVITFTMPNPADLGIVPNVLKLAHLKKGLVLVTGSAGCGKSTTLACMVDEINKQTKLHVITIEDPLEFLHTHNQSIISQREVSSDTESFVSALRSALRQSPDVILLGEMRDKETTEIAMTAAETGHLILSSLHTVGAANTIARIIDSFPPNQQQQISLQLSMILQAVVTQQLVPTKDGNMTVAFEIMIINPAVRNMIRENKVHQLDNVIASSTSEFMVSMDKSLLDLYNTGIIEKQVALDYARNPDLLLHKLN